MSKPEMNALFILEQAIATVSMRGGRLLEEEDGVAFEAGVVGLVRQALDGETPAALLEKLTQLSEIHLPQ